MSDICVGSAIAGNGCMKCSACKAELAEPASAKSSLVAATPSEDGREVVEVVEVVGYRYCASAGYPNVKKWHFQEAFPSFDSRKVRELGACDKLMTVAQHSRIVAEYEARIERHVSQKLEAYRKHDSLVLEMRELRAQPARQGGGDEREEFEAWHRSKFATKYMTGDPTRDMHNGKYDDNYGPAEQQIRWECWQARAALAPAAVAVVMPEPAAYRTIDEYGCCTLSVGKIHQDSRALVLADAVEYLNRRAIPVELIERCIQHLDWDGAPEKDAYDYGQECDSLACELRALLGKS